MTVNKLCSFFIKALVYRLKLCFFDLQTLPFMYQNNTLFLPLHFKANTLIIKGFLPKVDDY